jgi:uncharacterized membrane protein YeaQ/YmgE (transglycosylase-associated protein family)
MAFVWTIIVGFIAGVIAKLIMPGKDPGGFVITILLGIGGALLFTFLGRVLGLYESDEGAGIIGGVIGAILILWLYRLFLKRKK